MRRVRQLLSSDGYRLAEASLYLGVSQLGFLLPSRLCLSRWVSSALQGANGSEANISEARRLARITDAVARRFPLRIRCLQRSLVLAWLLRRRRMSGRLRIGVRRTPDAVAAHAWVEVAGLAVNDSQNRCSQFAVLERVDGSLVTLRGLENAT